MASFSRAAAAGSPLPTTLAEALQEIQRLRQALVDEHQGWAESWADTAQRVRSLEADIETYKGLLGLNRKT